MMAQEKAEMIMRIDAALNQSDMAEKARAALGQLVAKLRQPVRIGLFGFPGAGKSAVLNALAETTLALRGLDLPTLETTHGKQPKTRAMLEDGSSMEQDGYPTRELLELDPVFCQIETPAAAMEGRQILLVMGDAEYTDQAAALNWAAPRIDIAIWCSQHWDRHEQNIWADAPDPLHDHALLAITGTCAAVSCAEPFEAQFTVTTGQEVDGDMGGLTSYLNRAIQEALTQDLDTARLFLHRYAPDALTTQLPSPAVPSTPDLASAAVEPILNPRPNPAEHQKALAVCPNASHPGAFGDPHSDNDQSDARLALGSVFQFMRQSADSIRLDLPGANLGPDDVARHFTQVETLFEALTDRVDKEDTLEATWPDLCERIYEARDLSLLLRIEGGVEQLEEATVLLHQVRQDIELRLAP